MICLYNYCRDVNVLKANPSSSERTVFRLAIPLMAGVIPLECDMNISNVKLELKLKKQAPSMWETISPATTPREMPYRRVARYLIITLLRSM